MKLFVAVAAYDRRITCETARALLNEQSAGVLADIDIHVGFAPGSSLIHVARDQLARDFLRSDCDRMVFVDSDVSWEPGMLLVLAQHSKDFVGGAYRYKDASEGYPVGWLQQSSLWADPETGLLEVASLPGGFLSLSRAVFEKLQAAFPDRRYFFHGEEFHAFFHCPPGGGEDGMFCREWREAGGQVWLEPRLTLTHVEGAQKYTGCIGDWLKGRLFMGNLTT